MASFRCSQCGCTDDSALCRYWSAQVRDTAPLCSACDPKIHKWHGEFPRIFGVFLMTPAPKRPRRPDLAVLVEQLGRMERCIDPLLAEAKAGVDAERATGPATFMFAPEDPIPAYRPLQARTG
jgi:hypothetical protein